VSLALDLNMGHVSPQFHLWYNNLFEMVSNGQVNLPARVSKWQSLGGFREQPKESPRIVSQVWADIVVEEVSTLPAQPTVPPEAPEFRTIQMVMG
jgi:hypothetical protein